MGASNSKKDDSFRPSQWEEDKNIQLSNEFVGEYTIYRNRNTDQYLDKYTLQFPNEKQYNNYLETLSYRRNQDNIVRVIHYQPKVVKQFCGASYVLDIYLEHCRSRLSQYEDIPFPDYLYCAMAMLDGYKKFFSKIGRFYVSEKQVMIDENGQIRVWLNQNFSVNEAESSKAEYYNYHSDKLEEEYKMVDDIMRMIFNNSDIAEQTSPVKLIDFYEQQKSYLGNRVGFQQAKNIILDYSKLNGIQIPSIFRSVYEIYNQDEDYRNHENLSFKNQLLNQEENSLQEQDKNDYHKIQGINNKEQRYILPHSDSARFVQNTQVFRPAQQIKEAIPHNNIIESSQTQNYHVNTFVPPVLQQIQPNNFHRVQSHPNSNYLINQKSNLHFRPNISPIIRQTGVNQPRNGFTFVIKPQQYLHNAIPSNFSPAPINHQIMTQPTQFQQKYSPRTFVQVQQPPISQNQTVPFSEAIFKERGNKQIEKGMKISQKKSENQMSNSHNQQILDELEIQNHLDANNQQYNDHQNQQNIMQQLNQLHKIEQEERSRRSGFQKGSQDRNNSRLFQHREENEENYSQSSKKYQQKPQNQNPNHFLKFDSQEIRQSSESAQNFNLHPHHINNHETYYQNHHPTNSPYEPSTPMFANQPSTVAPNQQRMSREHQNYTTYPVQINGFVGYNANYQTSYLSQVQGKQSGKHEKNIGNSSQSRQFYYTLSNQIQLDPEIAADLAAFAIS